MKVFDPDRVNLYTILHDLSVNFWMIILAVVIGLTGSLTYYKYVRKYEYTSTMVVSLNLSGYTTSATTTSLTRTVIIAENLDDVFSSSALRSVVEKDLFETGVLDKSKGDTFTSKISAKQIAETNLITINVTDSTPYNAYNTARSVYNNYSKVTDGVYNNVIISVLVNPQMPTKPASDMSVYKISVVIAIIFAVLMTFLLVVLSYFRYTVKNPSDITNELDDKLFGVVNKVRSGGKGHKDIRGLIMTNPLIGYAFCESFRRMAIKLESLRRQKGIKAVMVTSVAENEGKTSTAVNIAMALSQNGHKVLLVDGDFKKPAVYHFFPNVSRPKNSDFSSFVDNGGDILNFIKRDPDSGIYVADESTACSNSAEKLSGSRFNDTIGALKKQFDFVIIDTPPCGLTVDAEIISESVDAVLMVVRQDYVGINDIAESAKVFGKKYFAGYILNGYSQLGHSVYEADDRSSTYYYGEM